MLCVYLSALVANSFEVAFHAFDLLKALLEKVQLLYLIELIYLLRDPNI